MPVQLSRTFAENDDEPPSPPHYVASYYDSTLYMPSASHSEPGHIGHQTKAYPYPDHNRPLIRLGNLLRIPGSSASVRIDSG